MAEKPINIVGWAGVDTTTDAFILGKKDPNKSSLAYNYRTKKGVRNVRNGMVPVVDFDGGQYFRKSGVYFPSGSHGILPHARIDYSDSFYVAGEAEFTLEFWYRGEYQAYDREIIGIPVALGSGITRHMTLVFTPSMDKYTNKTYLTFYMALGDGAATETVGEQEYIGGSYIPLDGEWHHLAIIKYPSGDYCYYILDDADQVIMITQNSGYFSYAVVRDDTIKEHHSEPHMYNHLRFGGDDISLAEIRIWTQQRELADIQAYKNQELEGDEENLVCYLPLNEGTDKYFTEKVRGHRGHFAPQPPYVDDDYRLIFTGYNCMAYPSLRPDWKGPDGENLSTHKLANEEAAYDGGILWDTVLNLASTYDRTQEGLWKGVAQIRLTLRQLKEGMLAGRLGMCYDKTEEAYRLFFMDETNAVVYVTQAVVNDTWIGVPKTITILYDGDITVAEEDRCGFFIDGSATSISESSPASYAVWGDEAGTSILDSTYIPYHDTEGTNDTDGAIGGSTVHTEMCVAFDLVFLRQWYWKNPDTSTDTFIANTYATEELDDSYRYLLREMDGYFERGEQTITLMGDAAVFDWNTQISLGYVRIPLHYNTSTFDMDGSNTYLVVAEDPSGGDSVFKQNVVVKKVYGYAPSYIDQIKLLFDPYYYEFKDGATATWGNKLFFNGAILSNLVNYYDRKTFKHNRLRRNIFVHTTSANYELVDHEIHDTITDDSPLQGIQQPGAVIYKSRYLILTTEDRHNVITGQRSLAPRWCDGPISPDSLPVVRGIYRYTSEDREVDRLLVVAWNSVWELDPANGTLEPQKWAWLDKNSEKGVSMLSVNNLLLVTDDKAQIKLNHKGNWSRLGIERPTEVKLIPGTTSPGGVLENTGKYAWVAQFYDSENDAVSGTIPVFTRQGVEVQDTLGLSNSIVQVRSCRDENVDRCRFFRTANYGPGGEGTLTDLFMVNETNMARFLGEFCTFKDVWIDDNLYNNTYLSSMYLGDDLLPPLTKGIGLGYNRVFMFNGDEEKSTLFWSDVDAFGFAKPDQFPTTYKMIIEEGDTTEGTALIEYSSQLFAFKENAIFIVEQTAPASFANKLIYKGVGAVNQRSVVVAGNALIFIDRSGIYRYSGGEPVMLSMPLADYFRDEVDQDRIIDLAFLLFNKTDDMIYAFLPSAGSTYCDRAVVFDLRSQTFSIDMIPYVTCGYVDDNTIYLGTPYGQVYRVSKTTYYDGVTQDYSGSGVVG